MLNGYRPASLFVNLFLFTVIYKISSTFYEFYVEGDLYFYNYVYESVLGESLSYAYEVYNNWLSSREPVHFLIVYYASNFGFDKTVFFSLVNGLFAVILSLVLRKFGVRYHIIIFFVITNYYLWVLYLPAERLKIAFILMLLGFYIGNFVFRSAFIAISAFAHIQVFITLAPYFISKVLISLLFERRFSWVKIGSGIFVSCTVAALLYPQIESKMVYLYKSHSLIQEKVVFLWLLSLIPLQRMKEISLVFVVLYITSVLLGPERVVMICFFYYLFYFHVNRKTILSYIAFILLLVFYGVKSLAFFESVLKHGEGFTGLWL